MGDYVLWEEHAAVVAPLEVVAGVSLVSFRDALARIEPADQRGALFCEDSVHDFNATTSPVIQGVRLDVVGGQLVLYVRTWDWEAQENDDFGERVPTVLAPLLGPFRAEVLGFEPDSWVGSEGQLAAAIKVPVRGRTVGEVVRLGRECHALLGAMRSGQLTARHVVALVAAGYAETLRGQRESEWLEGKGAPYRLDEDAQKLEFAKDVAAMANASGGVIVIGAHTRRTAGGDRIDRLSAIPRTLIDERRYRSVLASRVAPSIEGLRMVTNDPLEERGVTAIFVPPQRESLKPFIVRGAPSGDGATGFHLSVPVRDGEDIRYEDPVALQGQVAVGRAAQNEESATAALRAEVSQLRDALEPAPVPPPALAIGAGSPAGALYLKPDGVFVAWLHNSGGEAAYVEEVLLNLGVSTGVPEFCDGRVVGPGEDISIMFYGLRDTTAVDTLVGSEGRLVVQYAPASRRAAGMSVLPIALSPDGGPDRRFIGSVTVER